MIELFNQDCLPAMREMKDKQFDLATCDPQYGIGAGKQSITQYMNPSPKWPNPTMKQYKNGEWDSEPPSPEYFIELRRVSKNQIIWGANHFGNMPPSSCWLVWDKLNGESHGADCELAYTSFDSAVRKFDFLWHGFQKAEPELRIHPTQKPVKLYEWLLANYAKPGDKILDTHLGSGSIAIACHNLGFSLTGYEIDKDYYEAACKRLADHQRQGQLFVTI